MLGQTTVILLLRSFKKLTTLGMMGFEEGREAGGLLIITFEMCATPRF